MSREYDIDLDGNGGYTQNLPKVLDPVMTVQVVQKFMEVERKRNRRAFLWMSSVFFLVILLILSLFAGIGMHVLKNSATAASAARNLQAQTAVYASEVLGLSNRLERLTAGSDQIESLIRAKEDERRKEGRVLKADLERFGRWVESRTSGEKQVIEDLMNKIRELEDKLQESIVSSAGPAAPEAGRQSFPAPEARVRDEPEAEASVSAKPAAGTVPDMATEKIDGQFDIAMAEPVHVAVPEPPRDRGDISVVTFPNGDTYKGGFKAGLFHGWGEYVYRNGDRYEGYFENDMKTGKGTYVYSSGDKYVGDFNNDMREGIGSMLFASGDKYIGDFVKDTMTGKGARFYSSGNKYSGDFRSGIKQGNGVLTYFNGDSYKGEFKNDLRDGRGVYVFADGSKYVGEFKDDKRQGEGRFIFADGGEYIGGFKNGMKHGEGICVYPDGRKLKGFWKDDKFLRVAE